MDSAEGLPWTRPNSLEDTGEVVPLRADVTTIGRGMHVDVRLDDPSVSRLHAEIVSRGRITTSAISVYSNGTRVNGRPVARRLLDDGDVVSFGAARCRIEGLPHEELSTEAELRRSAAPGSPAVSWTCLLIVPSGAVRGSLRHAR